MAIQTINIGQYANDGSGDDLRTAFTKVNANFALLGTDIPVAEATNLGTNSVIATNVNKLGSGPYTVIFTIPAQLSAPTTGVYYYVTGCSTVGYNGYYLCSGSTINTISLTYPTNPGTFTVTTPTTISTSIGIYSDKNANALEFNSIKSSDNSVVITPNNGVIDIRAGAGVVNDPSPSLGGNLYLNGHIINGSNGDIQSTVYGVRVDVLNAVVALLLQNNTYTIDFGTVVGNYSTANLDMGYITTPIANGLDFGHF